MKEFGGFLAALACGFLIAALIVGGIACIQMWINESACEQRAVSRPDIPVEWHWNTGCIVLHPDATVVVSS